MAKHKMQGRDWHGWAFYADFQDGKPMSLCQWAEPSRPKYRRPTPIGKWVRVKFVPVDPLPRQKKAQR